MSVLVFSKDQLEFICPLDPQGELSRIRNLDRIYVYKRKFAFKSGFEQYYLVCRALIEQGKILDLRYRDRLAKVLESEFVKGNMDCIYIK